MAELMDFGVEEMGAGELVNTEGGVAPLAIAAYYMASFLSGVAVGIALEEAAD